MKGSDEARPGVNAQLFCVKQDYKQLCRWLCVLGCMEKLEECPLAKVAADMVTLSAIAVTIWNG